MNTFAYELQPQAQNLKYTDPVITFYLVDGKSISAPLAWFPRLSQATAQQLDVWELFGDREGMHWPEIDEDLSISRLLIGTH